MFLQVACLWNTPRLTSQCYLYSTLTNIALYLLGDGSNGTVAYKLLNVAKSMSFEITPMSRARVSSY